MNDSQRNDLAKLALLDDKGTPYNFVVDLLEEVFGKSAIDAQLIASSAYHYGESDCGVWPAAVADALLQTAQARIDEAGHPLACARTTVTGREIVGQDACNFCGKPSTQVKLLHRGKTGFICDVCLLTGANRLSENVAGTSFSHAHEVLNWHFGGVGQDQIETSIRSFPVRMRADFQLAIDAIFPPKTTKYLGIKSPYGFQTVEFANLWETGQFAQSIVPVQYAEIDIGEETPRRCIGNALWVLGTDELKHAVLVSQAEDHRTGNQIRLEIAAPQGEHGAQIAAQYFRQIEDIIDQAHSYRGKIFVFGSR